MGSPEVGEGLRVRPGAARVPGRRPPESLGKGRSGTVDDPATVLQESDGNGRGEHPAASTAEFRPEMQTPSPRRGFRVTVPRQYSGGSRLPRHRHVGAYAAVVLAGDFVEAGDRGRYRLCAGTVAFHSAFEAHQDDFGRAGAVVLDLPLSRCPAWTIGVLDEVDVVVRLARHDVHDAAALLLERVQQSELEVTDWPDELARALASEPRLCLATWAERSGLSPQTLSRGFRQAYGTTPKRFRAEHRTQRALRMLPGWSGTLGGLAVELGFADQAHMTRAVVSLTGRTPGQLQAKCVQDGSRTSG